MTVPIPGAGPEFQPQGPPAPGYPGPYMEPGSHGDGIPFHGTAPDGGAVAPEHMHTNGKGDAIGQMGATGVGDAIPYPASPGSILYGADGQIAAVQEQLRAAAETAYHTGLRLNRDGTPVSSPTHSSDARKGGYYMIARGGERVLVQPEPVVRDTIDPSQDRRVLAVIDLVGKARRSECKEEMAPYIARLLKDGKTMPASELSAIARIISTE